ncbi:MAG: nicotinate phosphoribosyltransferase [Thermoguttaceae bacterium]|nr:nicotinate phosphoribosyltransferase [Thermoguttaceae bacterium]MDW8037542.1 nicotinate phosphoribosyltransferase [Thermoguttaceae bacterium]
MAGHLTTLYRCSLALLTDLYQLTMAYAYWKTGLGSREAVFHMIFREKPFGGAYAVACGLATLVEFIEQFHFEPGDLEYLASLKGNDDRPLFEPGFLDFLAHFRWTLDLDAMLEGTVVFPQEPMVRVQGPLLEAQLLETPLLNIMNFQTLIATKAARVVQAARGEPVIEFGLRRAQGIDGAVSASRAAYVGGCAATSNVLAGRVFGIPVRGTHAHSWIMCFESELDAFQTYVQVLPNNAIFLVDTYDTLEGVRHAIQVGRWLRERGYRFVGIRLDSGDLAQLSIQARQMLDEAGFTDAVIIASNDLDEYLIENLKLQGAKICVWGVGTRLVTGFGQPALGGVYKLSAIQDARGQWRDTIKLSEQTVKVSCPGILQVRRFVQQGQAMADAIYDIRTALPAPCTLIDPIDITQRQTIPVDTEGEDLLVPVFRQGRRVLELPSLESARLHCQEQLALLPPTVRRFVNPQTYFVGLEQRLFDRKTQLLLKARSSRR